MKKKLYLHIGRPKVGSSALQHFLWENRKELAKRGYLYPKSAMFQKASHKLSLVFQPDLSDSSILKGASSKTIYRKFIEECEAFKNNTIVASSENLFLIKPKLVKQALESKFETKIVCYVRRQDEVLISSLIQEIKVGTYDIDLDIQAYANDPGRLGFLNYSTVLDKWAKEFGADNIIVRVHGEGAGKKGIHTDFMALLGIEMEGLTAPEHRINSSPALDVLAYIKMIHDSSPSDAVLKQIRPLLVKMSEKMGGVEAYDSRRIVSSEIKNQIMEKFASSNADLAKKYLGREDGVLFKELKREDIHKSTEIQYQGMDVDRLAMMVAAIQTKQQQQIVTLLERLKALSQSEVKSVKESWLTRLMRFFKVD